MSGGMEDTAREFGNIVSPSHYGGDWKIGQFISEQKLDFTEGSIVKYICRYKKKDGVNDLIKARNYIDFLIKREGG